MTFSETKSSGRNSQQLSPLIQPPSPRLDQGPPLSQPGPPLSVFAPPPNLQVPQYGKRNKTSKQIRTMQQPWIPPTQSYVLFFFFKKK